MVGYLDKKLAFLSQRRIQVSTHARHAVIQLSEKVLRIYYTFISDTMSV